MANVSRINFRADFIPVKNAAIECKSGRSNNHFASSRASSSFVGKTVATRDMFLRSTVNVPIEMKFAACCRFIAELKIIRYF